METWCSPSVERVGHTRISSFKNRTFPALGDQASERGVGGTGARLGRARRCAIIAIVSYVEGLARAARAARCPQGAVEQPHKNLGCLTNAAGPHLFYRRL